MTEDHPRTVGLFGATTIGVGAIVGGGVLALAGVAFGAAGPSALLAFALNGGIAILTALSFAELSAMFPQSGGTYTFAKRILSVQAAFTIGWIVWFASIVAGVLYALGFAEFAALVLEQLWSLFATPPDWLGGRVVVVVLALAALVFYALELSRTSGGGGPWATIGKVVVFAVIIAAGLAALSRTPGSQAAARLQPFLAGGFGGLIQAMGFTFIALQGFDLIAAAAGEIRNPGRTIPRAMLLSLAIALVVYLPLLLVIATVGPSGDQSVTELGRAFPETLVALSAQTFMGPLGFWLVVVAALLSMLSALQANLFAASRIAMAMALDHTLPRRLGRRSARGIPVNAVLASTGTLALILLLLPDVAAAGAAASLIFLTIFALVHGIGVLARQRSGDRIVAFRTPLFPLVPLLGGLACAALALFQGIVVPSAGLITLVWILIGLGIYLRLFAARASAQDALSEARDPSLVQLRGRSPLVLVPIANPANAAPMVTVAQALAPPQVGRVLLLSVVSDTTPAEAGGAPPGLVNAQQVLRESLAASFEAGLFPEALTTVSATPWQEIARVAASHRCESLLLGLADLGDEAVLEKANTLISNVDSDVVILRAPGGWQFDRVSRVLIPIGGKGDQEALRSRILGSLTRLASPEVTYLRVLPASTTEASLARARRALRQLTEDRSLGNATADVVRSNDPVAVITERAASSDLMILGLQRLGRQRKAFGGLVRSVLAGSAPDCAVLLISRRG